jgi:hypothetical protein
MMPAWEAMLETTCPFSFYRVSVDLAPQWFSVVYNMNRALPYLQGAKPLSRPGCWAYSDVSRCHLCPPPPPPSMPPPPFSPVTYGAIHHVRETYACCSLPPCARATALPTFWR